MLKLSLWCVYISQVARVVTNKSLEVTTIVTNNVLEVTTVVTNNHFVKINIIKNTIANFDTVLLCWLLIKWTRKVCD